jgi:hypothetical protein
MGGAQKNQSGQADKKASIHHFFHPLLLFMAKTFFSLAGRNSGTVPAFSSRQNKVTCILSIPIAV